MAEKENSVTITDNRSGKKVDIPIQHGTHGSGVFDVRKMYSELDMFTYDPGFVSTATCSSYITYIDGDEGILLYRGYPIEQLAEKSSFTEVASGEQGDLRRTVRPDYRRRSGGHSGRSRSRTG